MSPEVMMSGKTRGLAVDRHSSEASQPLPDIVNAMAASLPVPGQ
jgi:hypothetical protein